MVRSIYNATTVAMVVVVMVIAMFGAIYGQAGLSPQTCKAERRAGINACKPVLYGQPPSSRCCAWVRAGHVECVCPIITPKLAALIDVNRAVRIVEGCGRRVPHHFKCGSITTP